MKQVKENLINKTILKLDEYLTRINKFSILELTGCDGVFGNGVYEEDGSGVFDPFYIKEVELKAGDEEEDETRYKCNFGYGGIFDRSGRGGYITFHLHTSVDQYVFQSFRKNIIKTKSDRREASIWLWYVIRQSTFGKEQNGKD